MLEIADGLSKRMECRKLAAYLGVPVPFVDRQLDSGKEIEEVAYTTLLEWQKQKGFGATGTALHQVLVRLKRMDLADQFASVLLPKGEMK